MAVDVVRNAYKAFDRRGTGKISAKVGTDASPSFLLFVPCYLFSFAPFKLVELFLFFLFLCSRCE